MSNSGILVTVKLVNELYASATQYENAGNFLAVKSEVLTGFWTGTSPNNRRLQIELLDPRDLLAVAPDGFGVGGQTARSIARALAQLTSQRGEDIVWPTEGTAVYECHRQDGRYVASDYACWFSLSRAENMSSFSSTSVPSVNRGQFGDAVWDVLDNKSNQRANNASDVCRSNFTQIDNTWLAGGAGQSGDRRFIADTIQSGLNEGCYLVEQD